MITTEQVIQNILSDVSLSISCLDIKAYPLPEPHCPGNKENVKAFILGADPSNFSTREKKTRVISKVFDIGRDKRYFSGINQNLKEIGLSLENVFVQNMVRNYMNAETQSNSNWNLFADKWLPFIKQEFDEIDPARKLPVLVTAEIILRFLSNNPAEIGLASEYYNGTREIPLQSHKNKLERDIIPFYRHQNYSLKKQDFYREKLKDILNA